MAFPCVAVNGAVLQPTRGHAKHKRTAGAEDAADRGQHSSAAGRTASDPGGAPESPGSEPAGELVAKGRASKPGTTCTPRQVGLCLFPGSFVYCLARCFAPPHLRGAHALHCWFQMFLQKGAEEVNLSSVQMSAGTAVQQGGPLGMHGQVVSTGPLQTSIQQPHPVQPLSQQQTLLREKNTAHAQVRKAGPPLL